MIKKVAILTSGGDAPGMNSAIRAIVKTALANQIEPYLVYHGYRGLHQGEIKLAKEIDVDQYLAQGGTFIYSARYVEFKKTKIRQEAKEQLQKLGIDALVVIGGDGSYQGAQLLHELGVKTIALPGTIDNDISSSDFTIGYDTALNTIVENVDRVRDTMNSHNRAAIIEVMGHGCGDLALFGALATGAEVVVTNEATMTPEEIGQIVKKQKAIGKKSIIIIVSEHIFSDLNNVAKTVQKISGIETRAMSFAHIQRGGRPTAQERINAALMGMKAIKLLKDGNSGLAIGILAGKTKATPILEALALPRTDRNSLAKRINIINQR